MEEVTIALDHDSVRAFRKLQALRRGKKQLQLVGWERLCSCIYACLGVLLARERAVDQT